MTTKITKDSKIKTKSPAQESIPSFIRKTYDILDERKFPEIIDWSPEGNAILIKNPTEFCHKVLPAYFKHNNLTSFVRQLNMYNFHKRRTQNLDHIYYHELFQKGKKNLLKDIRRKSSENTREKSLKGSESQESSQSGQDYPTLAYENQFLKRLYNEAMSKISALEGQVNEMKSQNQSLWFQAYQKNDSSFIKGENETELTQEQLPMTCGISIPPLKLKVEPQTSSEFKPILVKGSSMDLFLSFGQEATESTPTEVSQNSPSFQQSMESEKCFDMSEPAQKFLLPQLSLTPQVSQAPRSSNDLFISRQDMSVGRLFETWDSECQNIECFADQNRSANVTQESYQDQSLLGKRPLELNQTGELRFNVPEPSMKRHELGIFNKKNLISTGTEEREIFKMMLRRESSVNEEYDNNMGFDLMDFNNPFCAWTKTA